MQKNITQNYKIQERVQHAEIYNTKYHKILERIPHVEKFNTKYQNAFHMRKNTTQNTRERYTRGKIQHIIFCSYVSVFNNMHTTQTQHRRKYITQNSTIPERVPHTEKYNTKFHNTRARYTRGKYITLNSTIPERVPHTEKYNIKFHNSRARSTCRKI